MTRVEPKTTGAQLSQRLRSGGFRFTPQRQHVYEVLLRKRDHPTAEEVFIRAKGGMPEISMATVYNCLDALVRSGLARQVTVDRGATRFCPNMREHCHFHCDLCNRVFDIDAARREPRPASGCRRVQGGAVTRSPSMALRRLLEKWRPH